MENCDFFPGHVVKNWDCPGKSGTDGHLRTAAPNFRPIYCSQTAGWIMMPLDTEVDLGPGDIVLDGDTAAPERGTAAPSFRPTSIVAKRSPISATAEYLV